MSWNGNLAAGREGFFPDADVAQPQRGGLQQSEERRKEVYISEAKGDVARALAYAGVVVVDLALSAMIGAAMDEDVVLRFSPNARELLDDVSDPLIDQATKQGIIAYLDEGTETLAKGGREILEGAGKRMPKDFLDDALRQQGLKNAPNGLKQTWTEGNYKYEVRIHAGESQYTGAQSIYRVSRQVVGQGTEYLGTDGNWYHTSVLKPTNSLGQPNPLYDANAAKITHIPLS